MKFWNLLIIVLLLLKNPIPIFSQDIEKLIFSGVYHQSEGDFPRALLDFERALELDSGAYGLHCNIGTVQLEMGEFEDAITSLGICIEKSGPNPLAYLSRGISKSNLNLHFEAIQDYTNAINLNEAFSKAYYRRATSKLILEDNRGAILDWTKYLELVPDDFEAYYDRGLAKARLNNIEDALKDFDKVIELNKNHHPSYFARGIANIQIGNLEKGCLDLSLAGEKGHLKAYDWIKNYCQ